MRDREKRVPSSIMRTLQEHVCCWMHSFMLCRSEMRVCGLCNILTRTLINEGWLHGSAAVVLQ